MGTPQVPLWIGYGLPIDLGVVSYTQRVYSENVYFSNDPEPREWYSLMDEDISILLAPARLVSFVFDGFAQGIGPVKIRE